MPVDPAAQLAGVVNTLALIALEELCQRGGAPAGWSQKHAIAATEVTAERLEGDAEMAFRSIFGHMEALVAARDKGDVKWQAEEAAMVIGLSGVLRHALQNAAVAHGTPPEDLMDIGAAARLLVDRAAA